MKAIKQMALTFWHDEEGATAIEYGLIAALVAVAIITAASALGTRLSCTFTRIADCMVGATNGTCGTTCP